MVFIGVNFGFKINDKDI